MALGPAVGGMLFSSLAEAAADGWEAGGPDGRRSEAQEQLRDAINECFRRSWRLRRLLDFSRPYRIPARMYRSLARARREAIFRLIRESAANPEEARLRQLEWAKRNLPHRGHRFTFDADFVAKVDALKDRLTGGSPLSLSLQVRTHRIFRLPNRARSIKKAIEQYLAINLGRQPTAREIANAQAVYSQRTHRS